MTYAQWIEVFTDVMRNEESAINTLSPEEILNIKVIMCRLAHTPPHVLFSVSHSTTAPSNASRAWSATHLTLGSWHAKVKQLAKKSAQKEARKLTQTTIVTDKQSNTLQLNKKPKSSVVSPEPKTGPPTLAGDGKNGNSKLLEKIRSARTPGTSSVELQY